jgi:NAD(P)-dependent dehydrogenase (short-subunit alcohol dehydrogenase family)
MSPNVVITGANRGIGLSFCKRYLELGYNVYAVCRQAGDELPNLDVIVIDGVDVSDPEDIEKLKGALHDIPIDLLINNAGIWGKEVLGSIDYDTIKKVIDVNALAPLRVTEALLGNMGTGSKIALITSRMGSIEDNTSGKGYDYRMSKAALNMAGKTLAIDLAEDGIPVGIYHPGFVRTDMGGENGDISAETAAERISERIKELNLNNSGSFWHSKGELLPW